MVRIVLEGLSHHCSNKLKIEAMARRRSALNVWITSILYSTFPMSAEEWGQIKLQSVISWKNIKGSGQWRKGPTQEGRERGREGKGGRNGRQGGEAGRGGMEEGN